MIADEAQAGHAASMARLAGLSGLRAVDGPDRVVGLGFRDLVVYDLNGVGRERL